jgi:hypothetical protein
MSFLTKLLFQKKELTKMENSYVDDCFMIEFEEFESEDLSHLPEFRALIEAGNYGAIEEGLLLAEKLESEYPNYYLPYFWFSILYCKQKKYDKARDKLYKGLRYASDKRTLCLKFGDLEWAAENLPEAVKWWIKSIIIQVKHQHYDGGSAFIYLSYIAEQIGLIDSYEKLRKYAFNIYGQQITLDEHVANKLRNATDTQGTESLKQAIVHLANNYLT